MGFFTKIRRALPHVLIALLLCVDILQVMHARNPGMRFLTSTPSVVLITSATVVGIIMSVTAIVIDNSKH